MFRQRILESDLFFKIYFSYDMKILGGVADKHFYLC